MSILMHSPAQCVPRVQGVVMQSHAHRTSKRPGRQMICSNECPSTCMNLETAVDRVMPCPAPQKSHTPTRPAAVSRLILVAWFPYLYRSDFSVNY